MKKVYAIRPEPGLSRTIAKGAARALPIAGLPLSKVSACGWTLPAIDEFDALLAGSANAFRYGGDKLTALQHLPVLAVGQSTADAARKSGFEVAIVGNGGLQNLLDSLGSEYKNLLRLAGEERVPLEAPKHTTITERVVYRLKNCDLPSDFGTKLDQGALILLHSASAATHFANECNRQGVNREQISLCALGPRILGSVGEGWQDARAAANPNESDLLALAIEMCQE